MHAVLKELADLESRFGEAIAADLRKTANVLLRGQFLFAGDRGATHAYEMLTSARFGAYFSALFDALGYELRINEGEQWVGLLPDSELELFPRMQQEHTRVLLVLALVWQEEINRGGAEARAVVTTTLNELFDRYRDVAARSRKESLTTTRFEEALREFERRSLVEVGEFDPDAEDKQVTIRPMVHHLVDGNVLDRLERFAADAEGAAAAARELHDEDAAE
jgi:hypothetical protein